SNTRSHSRWSGSRNRPNVERMAGCPSCGAPVGDTDFACRQCGRSFVGDPAAVARDLQNQASGAQQPQWQSAPTAQSYVTNPYAPPGANPYGMPNAPTPASVSAEASLALKHAFLGLFCLGFPFGWKAVVRAKRVRSILDQNPSLPGRWKADAAFYIGCFAVFMTAMALLDFISDFLQLMHAASSP
ncbi:MAG: hypothetical protein ACRELY_05765, partial [Polyangiaceae bacterium]